MMKDAELQNWVEVISLRTFNRSFRHQAYFNARLRTTGGRYLLQTHAIEINPKYVIELGEKELIGIIKHELCHYHLHLEGKGYRHGDQEFKQLMQLTASPRHCQPLPSAKQASKNSKRTKRYLYQCRVCGSQYKRKKRMDPKRYRCGKCQGEIKQINF